MRLPRRRRYPVWHATSILLVAVIVSVAVTSAVLLSASRPLVVELEWTVVILALCLFAFLATGLYRGLRIRRERFAMPSVSAADGGTIGDAMWWGSDLPAIDLDVDNGCLGAALMLLVSLLVFVLFVVVVAWVLPTLLGVVLVVGAAVWWLCYLALRRVFVLSKRCRGQLGPSMYWASVYTGAYTGWLLALLVVWHLVR